MTTEAPAPFVRMAEKTFTAYLTGKSDASGEWRYAFTEQQFDPASGAYSDAKPARSGTVGRNYATELNGREVAVPKRVRAWLKASLAGQKVYEFAADAVSYAATVGDGSTNPVVVTHGLGTADLGVTVREVSTGQVVYPTVTITATTVSVQFQTVPTTDQYRVIVTTGGGGTADVPPPDRVTLSGTVNDQPLTDRTQELIVTATTTPVTLTGITPGSTTRYRTLTVTNSPSSTQTVTLPSEGGTSSTTSRFNLPTATSPSLVLAPGQSSTLTYDPAPAGASRWVLKPRTPPPPWQPSWSGTVSNPALPVGEFPRVVMPALANNTTLTGFPAGFPVGVPILILNPPGTSFTLTIADGSVASSVGFALSPGADVVLQPGQALEVTGEGTKARDVGGSLAAGAPPAEGTLAAAGSTQGDAAPLAALSTKVTGADGTKGVILKNVPGYQVVYNSDNVNSLKVYPPSGANVGNASANVAVTLASTVASVYWRVTSTKWGVNSIGVIV